MSHVRDIGTQFGFTVIERDGITHPTVPESPSGTCELCGTWSAVRPVGPKNERICLACGLKDPVGTSVRLAAWMAAGRP